MTKLTYPVPRPFLPFNALQSLRVIEVGNSVAVAAAGRILRQLGANVTICEDRTSDEIHRLYFDAKKTTANFSSEFIEPDELGKYDVIIENFQPNEWGSKRRELLDGLCEKFPRLILTTITPFGLTGPYAGKVGTDEFISALSGLANLTPRDITMRGDGFAQPPLPMPRNLISTYAAIAAVAATLSALFSRGRNSFGQHIDISMLETVLPTLRREIAYQAYDGTDSSRFMRVWRLAPWGIKKCSDGFYFVQVVERHHWEALVEMMGNPAWALDPELADPIVRYNRRSEVDSGVERWIRTRQIADLVNEAAKYKLPFAPVNRPEDLQSLAQVIHRDFITRSEGDQDLKLPFITGS